MAITFHGAGAAVETTTDGATLTPALPASTQAGDIAFVVCHMNIRSSVPTGPTGYTEIQSYRGIDMEYHLWYKRLVGGDANPTVTDTVTVIGPGGETPLSGTNGFWARTYVYRGCIGSGTPFEDATPANSESTTPITAVIDTTGPNRRVVHFLAVDNNTAWSSGHPATGWNDEVTDDTSSLAANHRFCLTYMNVATAQTVAAEVVGTLAASNPWYGVTLALIEASTTGAVASTFTVASAVAGTYVRAGVIERTLSLNRTAVGTAKRFGAIAKVHTVNRTVLGGRKTTGAAALSLTYFRSVTGARKSFGAAASVITINRSAVGPTTRFGEISAAYTLACAVAAKGWPVGQVAHALTLNRSISGTRKTFRAAGLNINTTRSASGVRIRLGAAARSFTVTRAAVGKRTVVGVANRSISIARSASGKRGQFGRINRSISLNRTLVGKRTTLGRINVTLTLLRSTSGTRKTFGAAARSLNIARSASGTRTTSGSVVATSISVSRSVFGARVFYGSTSLALSRSASAVGSFARPGRVSMVNTFTVEVQDEDNEAWEDESFDFKYGSDVLARGTLVGLAQPGIPARRGNNPPYR